MELSWPKLYYQRKPEQRERKFNTQLLVQDKEVQKSYQENLKRKTEMLHQQPETKETSSNCQTWNKIK